jgi:rare lipoprotein A
LTNVQHALFTSVLTILTAASTQAATTAKSTHKSTQNTQKIAKAQQSTKHSVGVRVAKSEKSRPSVRVNTKAKVANKTISKNVALPIYKEGGFSQTGRASWYGPGFHGKRTSNGETFDMHALTAAHRTLPMSSYARVTNLANGKSIVVRINDRGPFHSNRVMDLSKGAATKLGFLRQGSANVKIEALQDNEGVIADVAENTTQPEKNNNIGNLKNI